MKLKHTRDYREARRPEYPAIEDQLDALWKVIEHLTEASLPPDAEDLLDRVRQVKARYPKPAPSTEPDP